MGYSKSIRAFNRVKNFLDEMVAKHETLTWQVDDPSKTAYNIREGIKVAKERANDESYPLKEQYRPFAGLAAKYLVRVKGATVIAEPRELVPQATPANVVSRMVLEDLISPFEVVGAAIK